ncbi:MAG: hypothetical protein KA791_09620 [Flavobacteriales bacterium]|nr:hypothetical protein [Flavobacteriales bacterium]
MDYIYYQRLTEGKDFTIGEFRISGTRIRGYFLEPGGPSTKQTGLDRRIPPGAYNLVWHKGKHWSNVVKLYNDEVPISRAILIHSGNSGKDTEGCLIAGSRASGTYVTESKAMLQRINKFLKSKTLRQVQLIIAEIPSAAKGGTA